MLNGTLRCWGEGFSNTNSVFLDIPNDPGANEQMSSTTITQLCSLKTTGRIFCTLRNSATIYSAPLEVLGLAGDVVKSLSHKFMAYPDPLYGSNHMNCVVVNDAGTLKCFGRGDAGAAPTAAIYPGFSSGVLETSSGYGYKCILTTGGAAKCIRSPGDLVDILR